MTRFEQFQQNVQQWATERGIYEHSTALAQALKAVSEVGELCDAVIKNDRDALVDAIGDTAVCVVNVAHFLSHTFDPDHFDPDNLLSHDHFRAAAEAARVVGTFSHQVSALHGMMAGFANDGCDRAITALREFCVCRGLNFDDCCEAAWQTIKGRKGRMVAGGGVRQRCLNAYSTGCAARPRSHNSARPTCSACRPPRLNVNVEWRNAEMLKRVLIRCADGAMIVLLVLGSSDARTFVAVVCGVMAFVAFISWFITLTDEQAERLGGKTLVTRVIGWGFTVGYVSGLIYASYPILAALYFFAILGLRAKVADTRKKAQSNEKH